MKLARSEAKKATVIINVLIGTMASYVIARFDFKLNKLVMGIFLVAMLIPFYTIEVARFKIIRDLHLYNTLYTPYIPPL